MVKPFPKKTPFFHDGLAVILLLDGILPSNYPPSASRFVVDLGRGNIWQAAFGFFS
jgi:hypothetical protein